MKATIRSYFGPIKVAISKKPKKKKRVQRKGNSYTETANYLAIMEIKMEVPQNTKNRTTI
jgi:hypothetical protein